MKKCTLFCLMAAITMLLSTATAQDITGDWYGKISIGSQSLRLNFHILQTEDSSYTATMDSPDQNNMGIPVEKVDYQNGVLTISVMNIEYQAVVDDNGNLDGVFKQAILKADLDMTHTEIVPPAPRRPQLPKTPYPYSCEEVSFKGGGDYQLVGTLVRPQQEGKYPVAVFISGSGPQNRDEEVFGHQPFLVISDYLARHGIASLRYDDRGTASSGGVFELGTSVDNAHDAAAAVSFLKEKGFDFIGLIGHSEGGLIAPMVASNDSSIAFIISLAGPGVSGYDVITKQAYDINKANGATQEQIEIGEWDNLIIKEILQLDRFQTDSILTIITTSVEKFPKDTILGLDKENFSELLYGQIASPWMFYFLKCDPAPYWSKVTCPVFALNGEKDLQVNAAINLTAIADALEKGNNSNFKIKAYPNLNHVFQHTKTGNPNEYGEIEETFSERAMKDMVSFIEDIYQGEEKTSPVVIILLLSIFLLFIASLDRKKKRSSTERK